MDVPDYIDEEHTSFLLLIQSRTFCTAESLPFLKGDAEGFLTAKCRQAAAGNGFK
jgi:hypothetical protein